MTIPDTTVEQLAFALAAFALFLLLAMIAAVMLETGQRRARQQYDEWLRSR